MALLTAWVVFPALLAVLSLGCGLLVEWAAGVRVPGALLLPVGLATIIAAAALTTATDATAELTAPVVVVLAGIGYATQLQARRIRVDWWAAGAALGVFAVFAAPVVLSGHATFAGYIKLDDTATWLAMTDRVMDHGRNLAGLLPSTYEATLANYLATGYPVGSFLPLGLGHELLRQDSAWLFQPWLAYGAAMLTLGLWTLVGPIIRSPWRRALVAFIAAQPALLFGQAMWGGVKEVASAWLIALVAAVIPTALARDATFRATLPLAIACAALVAVQSLAGVAWLAPVLLVALIAALRSLGVLEGLRRAGAFAALWLAVSIPALTVAGDFLAPLKSGGGGGVFTAQSEVGNLLGPINRLELFGVWPVSDFRVNPSHIGITHALIALLAMAVVVGLAWAIVREAWSMVLYVAATVLTCLVIVAVASPWVDAKSLAIASPALLTAGLAFAAAASEPGGVFKAVWLRIAASVAGAALAVGVLWSNGLAYEGVNLAPRDQLAQLEHIGKLAAGQGPTLMTDYVPYGARHFLRAADAEGASELRRRVVALRAGGYLPKGATADIDAFRLDAILPYRTLVLRRSALASRPPSLYRLVWSGHEYELWQRPVEPRRQILEHLSLGIGPQPAIKPNCRDVLRLAALAGPGGQLATVPREQATVVRLDTLRLPRDWQPSAEAGGVYPLRHGTLRVPFSVARRAEYGVWLGGSSRGSTRLSIDGRRVGDVRHILNPSGIYMPVGRARLAAGQHSLWLRYDDTGLYPGAGRQRVSTFGFGPLVLGLGTGERPVTYVPARRWRTLCGETLDWIEAIRA